MSALVPAFRHIPISDSSTFAFRFPYIIILSGVIAQKLSDYTLIVVAPPHGHWFAYHAVA